MGHRIDPSLQIAKYVRKPKPRMPNDKIVPKPATAYFDEEDDDEELEIKLSPSGSVLAATPNPYDRQKKIQEANQTLLANRIPVKPPTKVRFNEKVTLHNIEIGDKESNEHGTEGKSVLKLPPNKRLLVTVPTGFSEDGELNSDEDVIDETDFRNEKENDPFTASSQAKKRIEFKEYSVDISSEDLNDGAPVDDLTESMVSMCNISVEDEDVDKESVKSPSPIQAVDSSVPKTDLRPKSAKSVRPKSEPKGQSQANKGDTRPSTAPGRRCASSWATTKLPKYNGLRSEYGLSAEQLQERKRKKAEEIKTLKQRREQMYQEEKRRQRENELMFATWLVKKKKEAEMKAAKRRQQNSHYFRTLPAPTSHLSKMGILRKKALARREHTCYSMEEFFKNAKPHEQKTYRIYLGLCVE